MICIRCDATEFVEQNEVIKQDLGGDTISIETPASVCKMCGWVTVTPTQADELLKRTIDAYAKRKANLAGRPEPRVGQRYKSVSTGSYAEIVAILSDGLRMKHAHANRETKQSWKTFFMHWRPI